TTATCPNWVAVSSGGTATAANNASWQYNLASSTLTDTHTYTVSVQATDATTSGNQSGTLSAGTFVYDTSAPTATISFPATGTHYNSAGWNSTLSGTAADASSSVATVKVSIQKDAGANACWDGTKAADDFTSASCHYGTATGTTSWTTTLGSRALFDGSSYVLTAETIDNPTNANTNTSAATSSFVYTNSAPSSTVSFPAPGTPSLFPYTTLFRSGTAADASSSVATVKVSIQKDAGANACWD